MGGCGCLVGNVHVTVLNNNSCCFLYTPVFPEVGSIMVSPGFKTPSFSASSTILTPMRSFTEPPALKYSHLATILGGGGQIIHCNASCQCWISDLHIDNLK